MKKLKRMYRCIEELKYGNGKTTGCPTVLLRVPLGHDRQCGFTLVELVITIAIVIILSVISVPIYRGYVDKAKMAEGYALLGVILSAQKTYYSEYGNFLHFNKSAPVIESSIQNSRTAYSPVLGIDARGNKYFTVFHGGSGGEGDYKLMFSAAVFKPEELSGNGKNRINMYYNIESGSTIFESFYALS